MKTLNEVKLAENDRQAVETAGRLLRQHLPVDRVVLFGSKARGDDDAESDIDLLVLTHRRLSWEEECEVTRLLGPTQHQYSVVFSPVIVPLHDWEEGVYKVLPLQGEVHRDGVAV